MPRLAARFGNPSLNLYRSNLRRYQNFKEAKNLWVVINLFFHIFGDFSHYAWHFFTEESQRGNRSTYIKLEIESLLRCKKIFVDIVCIMRMYQRSAPSQECPPSLVSLGHGQIPRVNSMSVGAGHIIFSPKTYRDSSLLAGSQACSITLSGL